MHTIYGPVANVPLRHDHDSSLREFDRRCVMWSCVWMIGEGNQRGGGGFPRTTCVDWVNVPVQGAAMDVCCPPEKNNKDD
jgi:hypothetical protein